MENLTESIENIEINEINDTTLPPPPPKQKSKRVLSEAQLKNLEKAREKAKEALKLKRSRNENIKMKKRLIKTAKKEHEESLLDEELSKYKPVKKPLKVIPETVHEDEEPKPTKPRKARRKKIVYVSDSDSSEEEIIYKRRPKLVRQKTNINRDFDQEQQMKLIKQQKDKELFEQRKIDAEYNKQMERYRREMIRKAVFPD